MNVPVNYLAILLAAIAQMVLGFIWYGPLFGKAWQKMKGFSSKSPAEMKEMQKKMMPYYALTFVLSLITAYILAHATIFAMSYLRETAVVAAMATAFFSWLGYMLPIHVGATIFSDKKDWKLFSVDAGYWLVGMLLMGLVLAYLR